MGQGVGCFVGKNVGKQLVEIGDGRSDGFAEGRGVGFTVGLGLGL